MLVSKAIDRMSGRRKRLNHRHWTNKRNNARAKQSSLFCKAIFFVLVLCPQLVIFSGLEGHWGKTIVWRPVATVWRFGAWWFRGSWIACWSAVWFVIWWWWSVQLPLLVTTWGYLGNFHRGEKFWRTVFDKTELENKHWCRIKKVL